MKIFKIKRKLLVSVILILIAALTVYLLIDNVSPKITNITVTSDKLPAELDGFRIVQISDLHNAVFGNDNEKLLSLITAENPDIIVITGDIYDERKGDYSSPLCFASNVAQIAPTYFVTGNHEIAADDHQSFIEALKKENITVLDNESAYPVIENEGISLLGINDPTSVKETLNSDDKTRRMLNEITYDKDSYTILLAHRPELVNVYAEYGIDLVLSGHAHGGQIRLPFIGGLYAPHQGIFPEYDSGLYRVGSTDLIVSRGLGNSSFPLRIFNSPEIVSVELKYNGLSQAN